MADPDRRTGSRNIGEESSYKVRSTQDSFGAKWRAITKADPLEVDPTTK
jgi:hypothetical protein